MPIPLLVLLAGAPAPAPPPSPRLVVGHRGARARFPENTLPAVSHALSAGADGVEIDVRVSADDVLVLSHDATLPPARCRTFDGRRASAGLAIRGLSLRGPRRFDCGAVTDPAFPAQRAVRGTPIPTLAEVLDLLAAPEPEAARRATLFLELKREEGSPTLSPGRDHFARLVVDLLKERGFLGQDDRPLLRPCPCCAPSGRWSPRSARCPRRHRVDLAALARREEAAWIGARHGLLTAASVVAVHGAGAKVFAWTANAPRDQDRLAAVGVDAVGTDDPQALVERWKERGAR
ncbi:MAG: hypothetical protein IPF66_12485 [Holophagales bacterium]|nr:hypothetical protein [Holophagales bacterium]